MDYRSAERRENRGTHDGEQKCEEKGGINPAQSSRKKWRDTKNSATVTTKIKCKPKIRENGILHKSINYESLLARN